MSNPWDHLPNAKYIDKIISCLSENFSIWNNINLLSSTTDYALAIRDLPTEVTSDEKFKKRVATSDGIYSNPLYSDALTTAFNALRDKSEIPTYYAIHDMLKRKGIYCTQAMNAIQSLIAWDDCVSMLYAKPADLIVEAENNHRARLMYPACVYFDQFQIVIDC